MAKSPRPKQPRQTGHCPWSALTRAAGLPVRAASGAPRLVVRTTAGPAQSGVDRGGRGHVLARLGQLRLPGDHRRELRLGARTRASRAPRARHLRLGRSLLGGRTDRDHLRVLHLPAVDGDASTATAAGVAVEPFLVHVSREQQHSRDRRIPARTGVGHGFPRGGGGCLRQQTRLDSRPRGNPAPARARPRLPCGYWGGNGRELPVIHPTTPLGDGVRVPASPPVSRFALW